MFANVSHEEVKVVVLHESVFFWDDFLPEVPRIKAGKTYTQEGELVFIGGTPCSI